MSDSIALPGSETHTGTFVIQLVSTGEQIPVLADQTIVSALSEHGIDIPTSCAQGICGTCVTTFVDGEVDHRDSFLTEDERMNEKLFTPCCSRATSAILLIDL